MALLCARANNDFTNANSWGVCNPASITRSEANYAALTTNFQASDTFIPGAVTVDAMAVQIAQRFTGVSGTFTIELYDNTNAVSVASVTVNAVDIPIGSVTNQEGGWAIFKFNSVTLTAGVSYSIRAKTQNNNTVSLFCSTGTNWSKFLRQTTTQAPVAGDDMIIGREWTAASTSTARVISMNNANSTDYGSNSTSTALPAIAICDGGTLTSYVSYITILTVSGNIIVYTGGTLNIGTVASPVLRGFNSRIQFDCQADGDFGLLIRSGNCTLQGQSRSSGKSVYYCLLAADVAATGTALTVDRDTGWLNGDTVVIASTSKTYSENDQTTLNADATMFGLSLTAGLTYAHGGTSPIQAEVVNLSRNVIIEPTNTNFATHVFVGAPAVVDFQWTEFRYMYGSSTPTKRGVEIWTSLNGGSCNMMYCSLHDFKGGGLTIIPTNGAGNGTNTYIDSNVFANLNTAGTGYVIYNLYPMVGTTTKISNNVIVKCTAQSGAHLNQLYVPLAECKNNRFAGCGGGTTSVDTSVFYLIVNTAGSSNYVTPIDIGGNIVHSCDRVGFQISCYSLRGTGISSWRNYRGMRIASVADVQFTNLSMFGNTSINLILGSNCTDFIINGFESHGDSTYATNAGIAVDAFGITTAFRYAGTINNYNSASSGVLVPPAVADIQFPIPRAAVELTFNNARMAAPTQIQNFPDNAIGNSFMAFQRFDQTNGDNRYMAKYGTGRTDTTIYSGASPSLRMTPNNATNKFEMSVCRINVNSGQIANVNIKVRESIAGDGTKYNGNRIRLLQKANFALGMLGDVVLATATVASEGAFQTLSGATIAVPDDGVVEFAIDCDGTNGWINVDDATATVI